MNRMTWKALWGHESVRIWWEKQIRQQRAERQWDIQVPEFQQDRGRTLTR